MIHVVVICKSEPHSTKYILHRIDRTHTLGKYAKGFNTTTTTKPNQRERKKLHDVKHMFDSFIDTLKKPADDKKQTCTHTNNKKQTVNFTHFIYYMDQTAL